MSNNRRQFLKSIAATAAASTLLVKSVKAQKRKRKPKITEKNFSSASAAPNIIIVMTDQQRADVCKREGFSLDTTPFLDSLANKGVWFNKAYTAAPACVPARSSMLTGRFPNTTQVRSNHNVDDVVFQTDIIDVLKYRGYKTALIGKKHCYLKSKDLDNFKDFGHIRSYDWQETEEKEAFDRWMRKTEYHASFVPTPFPLELQYPYRIVTESLQWIDSAKKQPFFLWMSFPEPHNPYQVPAPYYDMFPPEKLPLVRAGKETIDKKGYAYRKQRELSEMATGNIDEQLPRLRSNYFGMLRLIDDQMKRFVTGLEEMGVMENTILVFLSDHGDYVGEYGMIRKGAGVPEVLMRISTIWYGKDIKAETNPHPAHVSITDVFPTICEAIGVDIPEGVQGRSLWPLLTGKSYPEEEFAAAYAEQGYGGLFFNDEDSLDPYDEGCVVRNSSLFDELNTWTQSGSMRMLRKDDWKIEYDMMGTGALYNLKDDPSEIKNLWDDPQYSSMKTELLQELLKRAIRYQDDIPYPGKRYHFKRDKRNYYGL